MNPAIIKTPCARCGRATTGRYCEECRKAEGRRQSKRRRQRDKERGEHSIYKTARWYRRFRPRFLAKHPLCAECLRHGVETFATEVDHIEPVALAPELAWDENNCQALCKSCHSVKTGKERQGVGGGNP